MRRLVVSPHPDDAEIGLGAVIARWARQGEATTIVVVTGEGDLTMVHSGQTISFDQRKKEQESAATILRSGLVFLDFAPAALFDQFAISKLVSLFDELFPKYHEVYLPLPSYAKDHMVVWEAGLAAFRPSKLDKITLAAYEELSNCHGPILGGLYVAKKYVEVTTTDVELQIAALLQHRSQVVGREQTLVGPYGVRDLAKVRGLEIGVEYAQVIYPIRQLI